MPGSLSIGGTFSRAWSLLSHNPLIVVPALVVGLVSAGAARVLADAGVLSWQVLLVPIAAVLLRLLSAVVAIAFTTGMSAAAWRRGRASLSDGAMALRRNGLHAFGALILLMLLGLLAAALIVPTFGLSVFAYLVFVLYTMPAALIGGRGAVESILESFTLAWRSIGVTIAVVVLIVVLAIAGGRLGDLAARIPFLGEAVGWIVMEAVIAYATLVVVGEYLQLSEEGGG
jgi:hypothetical protein